MSAGRIKELELLGWRGHRRRLNELNLECWALMAGAMGLLLIAIAGIGGQRNWWGRNLEVTLHTTSASGMSLGMPVKIAGYRVGQVRTVQLLNNGQVQVSLSVDAGRAHLIGPGSEASLGQDDLLGKRYIALSIDPQPHAARRQANPSSLRLAYRPVPGLPALVAELANSRLALQQGLDGAAALMQKRLPRSLDELDRTLKGGQRLTSSLERDLGGRAGSISAELQTTSGNINQTLTQLQSTLQQVHALAESSNQLLGHLNRSWLMRLLQPSDEPQLRNSRE